jgi:hypothetical protein
MQYGLPIEGKIKIPAMIKISIEIPLLSSKTPTEKVDVSFITCETIYTYNGTTSK